MLSGTPVASRTGESKDAVFGVYYPEVTVVDDWIRRSTYGE